MKALVYTKAHPIGAFAMREEDIPDPIVRERDVLVEVHAIGINPGEAFFRGTRSAAPGGRVLLGWEFSGVVVGRGRNADGRFAAGERVFGTGDMTRDGAWAEKVAVDSRLIAALPEKLSFAEAASLPIGSLTAWESIFRDQDALPDGVDRVLIIGGAGSVGSMATQLLKARSKAFVISTASRPRSKSWCTEMGADLVLDHSGDVAEQLRKANIPSVDMVLSTANTDANLHWIAEALRPFGHLSVVDGVGSVDTGTLMNKSITLHTEMVFSRIMHGSSPELQGEALERVAELVTGGKMRPILTRRFDELSAVNMKSAHEMLEGHQTHGKIVIAW